MKRYLLISLCALISAFTFAQQKKDMSRYLAGAVTETDGKVVFKMKIPVKNPIGADALFDAMEKWAQENYKITEDGLDNRVLLANKQEMDIACQGEQYLTFKRSFLVLDRTVMSYQLILNIEPNACHATIRNIRYEYQDYKTPVPAEEMITDKVALNKKGDKLNRYYDKFRIHTLDSVNHIFMSIDEYLNGKMSSGVASQPREFNDIEPIAEKNPVAEALTGRTGPNIIALGGFKKVTADKIPAGLLNSKSLLITGSYTKPVLMDASWGGTTTLLDKLMGLSTVQSSSQAIDNGQTYTISFFTEIYADDLKALETDKGNVKDKIKKSGLNLTETPSGAPAFTEAFMIIECRKAGDMPSGGNADQKTYMGEILNVWIK